MSDVIYKICDSEQWNEAENGGAFRGAAIDIADGYIHFSSASQVRDTAEKHFSGSTDLVLVAVDAKALGKNLKYEVSRGGALFPHLYGILPLSAVISVVPLQCDDDGDFLFPDLEK